DHHEFVAFIPVLATSPTVAFLVARRWSGGPRFPRRRHSALLQKEKMGLHRSPGVCWRCLVRGVQATLLHRHLRHPSRTSNDLPGGSASSHVSRGSLSEKESAGASPADIRCPGSLVRDHRWSALCKLGQGHSPVITFTSGLESEDRQGCPSGASDRFQGQNGHYETYPRSLHCAVFLGSERFERENCRCSP